MGHWVEWHAAYDDPTSPTSRRLKVVQREIATAISLAPVGSITLASLCAGDARDITSALKEHERRYDVRGIAIEWDTELAHRAMQSIEESHVNIDVVRGDAGQTSVLAAHAPYDVLIACGVFGNISSDDVRNSIRAFQHLVREGGCVIWTRHRRPPDQTPQIRSWFDESGFVEEVFEPVATTMASVGRNRRNNEQPRHELPEVMFHFVGDGSGAHS